MRQHGSDQETARPTIYGTDKERDEANDQRYTYDRSDATSILTYVDIERAKLVREFFEWRQQQPGGDMREAVQRWEVQRFGDRLFPAAHGMLLFAIVSSLAPGERRQDAQPLRRPTMAPAERQRAFDEAAGRAAREHTMPKPTAAETGLVKAW